MSCSGSTLMQPKPMTEEEANLALGLLNPKQRLFCEELLCDSEFSIKRAAEKAGYKNPRADATRLISLPRVQQLISSLIHNRSAKMEVTRERVLKEIACIAFSNPKRMLDAQGQVLDLKDMPDEVAAAISRFEVTYEVEKDDEGKEVRKFQKIKVWTWDKPEALNQAGKHLNLWNDININQSVTILDWKGLIEAIQGGNGELVDDPIEKRIQQAKEVKNGAV